MLVVLMWELVSFVSFDVRDNRTFSLDEALLWIMDLYFGQKP